MLKAKDIMTTDVITVRPETTIEELARILIGKKISGVPVVNEKDELMGVVTENDLISQNKRMHIPTVMRLFDAYIVLGSPGKLEREIRKMAATTVGDICTGKVITVGEHTSVEDVATIMADKKVHLIPVVEGKKVRGIIGKIDVIRGIGRGES